MTFAWILFLTSGSYLVYIIVIYPLLAWRLAQIKPNQPQRRPFFPSIFLAVHNGAAFLRQKLDSIFGLDYPAERMQVIIVDDGSTDATRSIAAGYGARVHLISIPKSGKCQALNHGMQVATGEVLVFTDVRQLLAADSVRLLLENLADPSIGAASGELQIRRGVSPEEVQTGLYWKYEKWLRSNLSAIDSIFGATGALYVLRRQLARSLPPQTLNDDMYLPLNGFFQGYRLIVDSRARMYDQPTALASEFARKVRTLAGNYQVLRHYPQLLSWRNRMLGHYLSYKLGRLFLPFAWLLGAVSSLLLGPEAFVTSFVTQICLYGLALADPRIAWRSPLKRLSTPLRSFFTMMLATACAIAIWFMPPERLWRTPVSCTDPVA
jgi:cellulose synthase/poly-beta-1,6-N-acetylglucosamine synthase-like glycosyltransferase